MPLLISLVHLVADITQVDDAVVARVAVDMIDDIRPVAMNDHPGHTMSQVRLVVNFDGDVT